MTERLTQLIENGWFFQQNVDRHSVAKDIDHRTWEQVTVPHDWAIQGPFSRDNDIQITYIEQDGQWEEDEHIARTGGLPHVGEACYRLAFDVPDNCPGDARFFFECDGIMSHSEIYCNGEKIGGRPSGYTSFAVEATSWVKTSEKNILAVYVNNKEHASRWYPGAGIYRPVRMVITGTDRIANWGVTIQTPEITESSATVTVKTELDRRSDQALNYQVSILDGDRVIEQNQCSSIDSDDTISFEIKNPKLWSLENPVLYTARVVLLNGDECIDSVDTSFGIRTIEWVADKGFFLNGRSTPLNGVCMHHDLGPLGIAHNQRALERQWDILQDMGCNALRTSHNPPSQELLDLCDRRGILVIDEAFDEWKEKKVENGYHALFDEWAEDDLRSFIRRDRNHPSIIMWSLGNEIPEQHDESCRETARFLKQICQQEDPTRPVTAGVNLGKDEESPLLAEMDIAGMNYQAPRYKKYRTAHPQQPLYGSETSSCISSRGVYEFPVDMKRGEAAKLKTMEIPSYDLSLPAWGNLPDVSFAEIEDTPGVAGEFVWTGFDYLGEPSPFYTEWPVRSSHFGIIDLAGIPKDRFYLYRSHWNRADFTLHLLPHWTWPGREGELTPVHCYTSAPKAELFVNGVSQGVREKNKQSEFDRYRLRWNDVIYQPGCLRVVAMNEKGSIEGEHELHTAGDASHIELQADRNSIFADGKDLAFLTVSICDSEGQLCPESDNALSVNVTGGTMASICNGSAADETSFLSRDYPVYKGMAVIAIKSMQIGTICVTVSAENLSPAKLDIHAVHSL